MINLTAVAFFDPPDKPVEREAYLDVGLIPRAEAERLAALSSIRRARIFLDCLADVLRVDPSPVGDAIADDLSVQFGVECERAGGHIVALRQLRECQGEG